MEYKDYSEGVKCAIKELYTEIGNKINKSEEKLIELNKLNHKETVLFSLFESFTFKSISIDIFDIPKDIEAQIENERMIVDELKRLQDNLVKVTRYSEENNIEDEEIENDEYAYQVFAD